MPPSPGKGEGSKVGGGCGSAGAVLPSRPVPAARTPPNDSHSTATAPALATRRACASSSLAARPFTIKQAMVTMVVETAGAGSRRRDGRNEPVSVPPVHAALADLPFVEGPDRDWAEPAARPVTAGRCMTRPTAEPALVPPCGTSAGSSAAIRPMPTSSAWPSRADHGLAILGRHPRVGRRLPRTATQVAKGHLRDRRQPGDRAARRGRPLTPASRSPTRCCTGLAITPWWWP